MNILQAMESPELYGDAFVGESWQAWKAVLSGAFAIEMDDERTALFKQLSGDREAPKKRVRELYVISGRRCSKSHCSALIASYLATIGFELEGLKHRLSAGERGVISILAVDRSQARVVFNYIKGIFDASPLLNSMVHKRYAESLELTNGVSIEVGTSNYRAIRGRSLLACIFDEVAFFRDSETSESNDVELYRAALPAISTTNGVLIGISSPYSKRGLLFDKYSKHYGQDSDDILVIKAATLDLNPTLDPAIVEQALTDDPESAQSEWLGNFREGLASYASRDVVLSCCRARPLTIPPQDRRTYIAFVDPAGGGESPRADRFSLAIAYRDHDRVVVAGVWYRRGNPAEITQEYAGIMKAYRISVAHSDRYAGAYPANEFARHGITLKFTDKNRSQLYLDLLPVLQTGRIEMPPDDVLIGELCNLERKPGRLQDTIDHSIGAHDDVANVIAGVCYHTGIANRQYPEIKIRFAI